MLGEGPPQHAAGIPCRCRQLAQPIPVCLGGKPQQGVKLRRAGCQPLCQAGIYLLLRVLRLLLGSIAPRGWRRRLADGEGQHASCPAQLLPYRL